MAITMFRRWLYVSARVLVGVLSTLFLDRLIARTEQYFQSHSTIAGFAEDSTNQQ